MWDMCLCLGCGDVCGVREVGGWIGPGSQLGGYGGAMCVRCESGLFV